MVYTAPPMATTYRSPWPSPVQDMPGSLGLLHFFGDIQTWWAQVWPSLKPNTVYDEVGFDMRDRITVPKLTASFTLGDCHDGTAGDITELTGSFNLAKQWVSEYELGMGSPLYWCQGNHDRPGKPGVVPTITNAQWAAQYGYNDASYRVDLGEFVVIVLAPSGTGEEMTPLATGAVPVRPFTDSDLARLDGWLRNDARPTIIVNHAPIPGMATALGNEETEDSGIAVWARAASTVSGGAGAGDLKAILAAYPHVVAWIHGHTHSAWNRPPSNVSMYDLGPRSITVLDGSCIFQRPRIGDRVPPVSNFVNLMDDGKTLRVRWRHHGQEAWTTPDGNIRVWTTGDSQIGVTPPTGSISSSVIPQTIPFTIGL